MIVILFLVSCSPAPLDHLVPTFTARPPVILSTKAELFTPSKIIPTYTLGPSNIPATELLTATPTPVATPTPFSVAGINLTSILLQEGDLPSGITSTQTRDVLPDWLNGIDSPLDQIYQEFEKDSNPVGGMAIMIFPTPSDAAANYMIILWHMGGKGNTVEVRNLGNLEEEARITIPGTVTAGGINVLDLVFQRCVAVVQIHIIGEVSQDSVIAAAKKLDERLIPIFCPKE